MNRTFLWNNFAKCDKLVKYLPYCTCHDAITSSYWSPQRLFFIFKKSVLHILHFSPLISHHYTEHWCPRNSINWLELIFLSVTFLLIHCQKQPYWLSVHSLLIAEFWEYSEFLYILGAWQFFLTNFKSVLPILYFLKTKRLWFADFSWVIKRKYRPEMG